MSIIKNRILPLILLILVGCNQSEKQIKVSFWQPNPDQIKKAEEVAKIFASEKLNVDKQILDRAKYKCIGWEKNSCNYIYLQFYDLQLFPDWEHAAGVLGGFPHYFTIEINVSDWSIADYYASPE